MKKPTYAFAILTSLVSVVAGLLVIFIPWVYSPLLSSIFLALGVVGLSLIFIQLFVKYYCRRRGKG